jgi:hypothetical protein
LCSWRPPLNVLVFSEGSPLFRGKSIITPLVSSFGYKPAHEQQAILGELQLRANSAGLRGTVVPVWGHGNGGMAWMSPPNRHPFFRSIDMNFFRSIDMNFFRSIDMNFVHANVNREIRW